jgi:citrate lyase subunit beta / citryl-CoA lyase
MRSLLFVPGDSERKLEKALGSGSDVLIVDLEDSVAVTAKQEARRVAAGFVSSQKAKAAATLYVRVNDLSTGLTDDDLAAVMAAKPDGIMLPKSSGGDDVMLLSAKLRVHEAECGINDGATGIIPIITETAIGVLSAASYRATTTRLAGITWGAEDLSAAIGARSARDGEGRYTDLFRHARTMTLLAASAAGVPAIDTVFPDFRNEEAFRLECAEAERDGFTARMAIHPSQVTPINEAFTPSPEAVADAERIVTAFREAGDPGVLAIDGKMVDRPHLKLAERILARAAAAAKS